MADIQIIGGGILNQSNLDRMNAEEVNTRKYPLYRFAVTSSFHEAVVWAKSEGDARRTFHKCYNGESITRIRKIYCPE